MTGTEPVAVAGAGSSAPVLIDGVDIDAVVTAVKSCPAVDDLYSTTAATVTSYLPGRQVPGIRVHNGGVTVQVRSRWAIPIPTVAAQIRLAVTPLVAGQIVNVVVADISDAPDPRQPALPVAQATSIG